MYFTGSTDFLKTTWSQKLLRHNIPAAPGVVRSDNAHHRFQQFHVCFQKVISYQPLHATSRTTEIFAQLINSGIEYDTQRSFRMQPEKFIQCLLIIFLIRLVQYHFMNHQLFILFGDKAHKSCQTPLHLYFCRTVLIIAQEQNQLLPSPA